MAVGDAYVFPGFLTPVLTQLFFQKPPTTFLTYFCRGERRKYAGKKSRLYRGSNSQPPGHESDTLTSHPGGAKRVKEDQPVYYVQSDFALQSPSTYHSYLSTKPFFSPFPTLFLKALFLRAIKSQDCVVKD